MTEDKKPNFKLMGLVVAATLSLAACNTIEGAGKDIESVGEEVEEAAS